MRVLRAVLLLFLALPVFAQTGQKSIVVEDMNKSADPCNDFFDYSNGAWRKANPIPPSMQRWSRRWQAGEQNKEALKVILDDVSRKKDWPSGSVEQLIGDFYGACMDEATVNRLGTKPIQSWTKQIDGMKSTADVQKMIRKLHDAGVGVPFGMYGAPDNHEPTQTVANLYASGLGLPDRDYYFKTEDRFQQSRAKYKEYVATIFKLDGASEADAAKAADTVMAMETRLADASLDNVALRDPQATDHKTTFANLEKMTPHFDWSAYFKQAGLPNADLNVTEPKFMAEVDKELASTPLADWKTYLKWQLLNAAAPSLSQPFVEANFQFYQAYLGGSKEMKPRWKRCVEQADNLLGEALGKKYVEKYFPPEAKTRMKELVHNELLALHDIIQGLDWMSPETKQKAMEKLSTFNPKIGYPDKWRDYSMVPISRTDYFADVMAGNEGNVTHNRKTVGKPTDRGQWGMTPPTSNAYYNAQLNEIVFPAGILLPPAFSVDNLDAVNYGAIGVIIGHEISHGFDDQGAQFDALGRLNNWWTAEDLKKFQTKGACVVDQFENYYIEPNIHHNGKLVLGESIGDLAGAKIAYLAFQKAKQSSPAPTVDGFTSDQQFFIAWGQFRGDETRPEAQRVMIQGDEHPVAKFRVIGPLSNFPPFAKAFSCKAGTPMVRPAEKRCEVW
ncbi:MAG: M13 family metallopeptidase [Candidatus Koribacter versatilis]|uniref:M13 family metallopeptidase n=1 Tax=Candidatus Korobacter versatilis TaxID=658062 RepID=A0A932A841_9BACT|nr:M13 family metallopeptidase [Candidatus Koribacter versatilis]